MPRVKAPEGYLDRESVVPYLHEHGVKISESAMYRQAKKYGIGRTNHWYKIEDIDNYIAMKTGIPLKKKVKKEPATFEQATFTDMIDITRIAGLLFTSATITPIPALTRQQWLFKERRGHYVVRKQNGGVVAYIHIVAVHDEWAERYMRGEVYGRNLTGEDVLKLEPGIPLTCIVLSIGTDPDIESQSVKSHYVSVLLRGVENELAQLGEYGIIISRLYAFSETRDGRSLSTRLGMQTYGQPMGRRINFVMEPLQAQVPFLRRYQVNIQQWMHEHEIGNGSDRATMDEKGLAVDKRTKTQANTAKPSYTRRNKPGVT